MIRKEKGGSFYGQIQGVHKFTAKSDRVSDHARRYSGCRSGQPGQVSQQEAAVLAVKRRGLNQTAEIREEWFAGREKDYEMFRRRLELLRKY